MTKTPEMTLKRYDVAVFGAGLAGVAAAINAKRSGKKVILVENSFTVGGNATLGLVNPFMRFWIDGNILAQPLFKEILDSLRNLGGLHKNSFDSELLKIVIFEKLKEVDLLFRALPIEIITTKNRISRVIVQTSLGNRIIIESTLFIDATGDGSLAYLAGCEYESGDDTGSNQAVTLMFVISGVNFAKVREKIRKDPENFFGWVNPDAEVLSVAGYFKEVQKAKKDGVSYPNEFFFFNQLPGTGRVTVNTTHLHVKTTDDFELSKAMALAHQQVWNVYLFAKNYIDGFEKSYIEKIGSILGIRESRRIRGHYRFSGHDVINKARFNEPAVRACYGIDVHKKDIELTKEVVKSIPKYEDYYEIPLSALLSKEFENLAVVGRCLSSDFLGQSAARIMPTCFDMGALIGQICGEVTNSFSEKIKKEVKEEGG